MNKEELIQAIVEAKPEFNTEGMLKDQLQTIFDGINAEGSQAIIDAQNEKIEELSSEKEIKRAVVTHKKKKFQVVTPKINLDGEIYDVADFKENKDNVVDRVLKIDGQNIFSELT